jgi:SAM-dependent methyltransferase
MAIGGTRRMVPRSEAEYMTAELTLRKCAICGMLDAQTRFRQTFAPVDGVALVNGYDVVSCNCCGFVFASGIPEQSAFDRYYREMSKYEYSQRNGRESEFDARRLDTIAAGLASRLPSTSLRIVDIGCASGRFLASLRDRGFGNIVGLDPSPACAATARRLYSVPVHTMTLGELAASGESFDVVTLIGVLEHLQDLDLAFEHLTALLPVGGLLYVEVPDVTTFADWSNAPYQDFSTEHINFFGPRSLMNLMQVHGFEPVFVEQNCREQSRRTIMSNISAMFRRESTQPASPTVRDQESVVGLQRYLTRCAVEDLLLKSRIDQLVIANRPILVWGVGTHTTRLLATSRLAEVEIVAYIESNARYHGLTLNGRPILEPTSLKQRAEPVLISSRVFQDEIVDQIRSDLRCANELILLYDV